MKLIVGLGNPGKEYENTRHNAGFMFIDYLAKVQNITFVKKFRGEYTEFIVKSEKVALLKPQTFMNDSGRSAQEAAKFYKLQPEDIYIAFDDLDLAQSDFKIQKGKYPKVNNGVNDIIEILDTDKLNFIRIGIDAREPQLKKLIAGGDYVLQKTAFSFEASFKEIEAKLALSL